MADVQIDQDAANIPAINVVDQSSDPSAPGSGHVLLYSKGGSLYVRLNNGTVAAVGGLAALPEGRLAIGDGDDLLSALALGTEGDVVTADASGFATWATPAPGGGASQSFGGYNTIGASWETMITNRLYAKKITLAAAAVLLSVDAYVRGSGTHVHHLAAVVAADSTNSPGLLLSTFGLGAGSYDMNILATGRWLSMPSGVYLAAGDYWLIVQSAYTSGGQLDLAYDASAADRYSTAGGSWLQDGTVASWTDPTRTYSIRANLLALS